MYFTSIDFWSHDLTILQGKIMLYKAILKPVWTYGIQLWGTASNSNIEILQQFQSETLRFLIDAPWYSLPTKQYIATLRYPQLKKKYPNSAIDIT